MQRLLSSPQYTGHEQNFAFGAQYLENNLSFLKQCLDLSGQSRAVVTKLLLVINTKPQQQVTYQSFVQLGWRVLIMLLNQNLWAMEPKELIHDLTVSFVHSIMHLKTIKSILMCERHLHYFFYTYSYIYLLWHGKVLHPTHRLFCHQELWQEEVKFYSGTQENAANTSDKTTEWI